MVSIQGQPYDNCVDTSQGIHDFERNVYEELYPEAYYNVLVLNLFSFLYSTLLLVQRGV